MSFLQGDNEIGFCLWKRNPVTRAIGEMDILMGIALIFAVAGLTITYLFPVSGIVLTHGLLGILVEVCTPLFFHSIVCGRVALVLAPSNDAEVLHAIVTLVSVYVVHFVSIGYFSEKSLGYESVDEIEFPGYPNTAIAIFSFTTIGPMSRSVIVLR